MPSDGDRLEWLREVQSYLYARLTVSFAAGKALDTTKLAAFVAAVRRGSKADFEHLFWMFHLLRPGGGLDFIERYLEPQLRNPAHARVTVRSTERRGARGRVDWARSILKRAATSEAAILVVQARLRSYDTPENGLLVGYLRALLENMKRILDAGEGALSVRLSGAVGACEQALRSAPFRDLPRRSVTNAMRGSARRAKQLLYRDAVELWDEYEAVCGMGDLDAVQRLLSQGWLEPTNPDDLFELFVLVKVLKVLEDRLVAGDLRQVEYGLVRKGARTVARIRGTDWTATVWFNLSPHEALQDEFPETQYVYKDLLAQYEGLSGAARRPDVLVLLESRFGSRRVLLVEAKNARASDEYGRESLYKVLGYLKDFERLWSDDGRPKAVLAYRSGSKPKPGTGWMGQALAIFSADHFEEYLRVLVDDLAVARAPDADHLAGT